MFQENKLLDEPVPLIFKIQNRELHRGIFPRLEFDDQNDCFSNLKTN